MRNFWNFYSAGQLAFGSGASESLGSLMKQRGFGRIFIVTDPNLVSAGIVSAVGDAIESASLTVEVFEGGEPEPSISAALEAVDQARAFKPDAIVGLGGGSNMDLAKMTSILFTHGGLPSEYFGFDQVPGPVVPIVGVPTTAGTGSEVSHASVLTDTENRIKVSTLSPHLRPALAVVDPKLTFSCPERPTADSGIDALTHAIEAYCAIDFRKLNCPPDEAVPYDGKNAMGDLMAERAISLIGKHLVAAVKSPGDLAAREGMSLAATLAGLAFSNCAVAVVHALEYPMGAALHCSHGAGNGLLLPYVMRYNLPNRLVEFGRIADFLGRDISGCSEEETAQQAIDAVVQIRRDIGIPERIRDLGGREEQLPEFAAKAFSIKRLMDLNPRTPTEGDLLGILRDAF